MKFKMFAIRDEAARGYTKPFIEAYDEMAVRSFQLMCQQDETFRFKPADFSLWQIGEYDNETGDVFGMAPVLIVRGDGFDG